MKKINDEVVSAAIKWYLDQDSAPTLAETARQFGMHTSTLQRKFAERGVTIVMGASRVGQKRKPYKSHYGENRECPCGTIMSGYYGDKFCSDECRTTYQMRGKTHGTRVTKLCRRCGEYFDRPSSYAGKMYYCSNECALRANKRKQHLVFSDSDILLDSSYEGLFWCACQVQGIVVERFDRQYGVAWNGEGTWYAPDFWLPDQQLAVETKGFVDHNDEARWAAFRKHQSLLVLIKPELQSLSQGFHDLIKES